MQPSIDDYRRDIETRIATRSASLERCTVECEETPGSASDLIESCLALSRGGKRLRAMLVLTGLLASGAEFSRDACARATRAGAAVELFHLGALIHDDIIDASHLRRGVPTVHSTFTQLHQERKWQGDARHFGTGIGVVAGDAINALAFRELAVTKRTAALEAFITMCEEVAYGQYLDLRAEVEPEANPLATAFEVIRYKTVSYSALYPLVIGARLADGNSGVEQQLEEFALPFGEAFQLRDDDIGIFGESEHTGKPAANDITEGKRTVLRALAEERLSQGEIAWLGSLRGRPLQASEVSRVRDLFTSSGARERHNALIRERQEKAATALEGLPEQAALLLRNQLEALGAIGEAG